MCILQLLSKILYVSLLGRDYYISFFLIYVRLLQIAFQRGQAGAQASPCSVPSLERLFLLLKNLKDYVFVASLKVLYNCLFFCSLEFFILHLYKIF